MNGLVLEGLDGLTKEEQDLNKLSSLVVVSNGLTRLRSFFSCLSGKIASSFTYDGKPLLENPSWYHDRYYFDFSMPLASTLDALEIREVIGLRYGIGFNVTCFAELVGKFGIRKETTISTDYEFTARGQALLNYAFALSLEGKPCALVMHPLIGLADDDVAIMIDEAKKTKVGLLISGFSLPQLVPFDRGKEFLFLNDDGAWRASPDDVICLLPLDKSIGTEARPLFLYGHNAVYRADDRKAAKASGARLIKIKDLKKASS